MKIRRGWRCAAIMAAMLIGSAAPAQACVLVPVNIIASSPRKAAKVRARMEREDSDRREATRAAEHRTYLAELRAGLVEPSQELAARLIPNVRESPSVRTDCDPPDDADGPVMPRGKLVFQALVGSEFDGLAASDLGRIGREYADEPFNPDCSAELRAAFAAQLAASLSRSRLLHDCLKLCRAGSSRSSAAWFIDAPRERPPVWRSPDFARDFAKHFPDLDREVRAFWNARTPDLPHPARLCPAAWQADAVQRATLLAALRQDADYAGRLSQLARRRKQSQGGITPN